MGSSRMSVNKRPWLGFLQEWRLGWVYISLGGQSGFLCFPNAMGDVNLPLTSKPVVLNLQIMTPLEG